MSVSTFVWDSAWGEGTIDFDGENVVGVCVPGEAEVKRAIKNGAQPAANGPADVADLAKKLSAYVDGDDQWPFVDAKTVKRWLTAAGIDGFRRDALMQLLKTPYGVTISYGDLADLAGNPRAARAAGSACANNPLLLVIPCHRVLPASGQLGNYGTLGPVFKRRLLELEGAYSKVLT